MQPKIERDKMPMRVRFGPSPTGITHLGSARTALYNYLLSNQSGGQFILRIEDTDQKRYDPNAEDDLINSLKWLGIQWDEGPDIGGEFGPYRQSERKAFYLEAAEELIDKGHAYYCFCSKEELDQQRKEHQKAKEHPHYSGRCRLIPQDEAKKRVAAGEDHVIRFKMPKEGTTTVFDRLRGEITFENQYLDDTVIVKTNGLAVYHLATMVDDHMMKITHVLRGEEWIPTFPLHARIYRAMGWEEPEWIHLSLFLKPSGKGKMSKRDTEQMRLSGESIFIKDMRTMGYLPESVLNWVALMGWSYDDHTEFFTVQDMIELFSIDKLSSKNAAIDFKKLDYFNGLHIRGLPVTELAKRIEPFLVNAGFLVTQSELLKIAPLLQPRLTTLDEAPEWVRFLFVDDIQLDKQDLIPNGLSQDETLEIACEISTIIDDISTISDHQKIEIPIRKIADARNLKVGQVFGILRMAVTGQAVSPPLMESIEILGKERAMERIAKAIQLLQK